MRSLPRRVSTTTVVFFVAVCMFIGSALPSAQLAGETLVGRLATVEPANRRVTVVPEGEVDLVEMFVAADGKLAHEERDLTLADLVIQVGRRVLVSYRVEGDRRIADSITVDPE